MLSELANMKGIEYTSIPEATSLVLTNIAYYGMLSELANMK